MRDTHLPESGPCRRRLLIGESRIPFPSLCARLLLEDRLERTLPALAERRDAERAFHLRARVSRQIQESIHVGDGDPLRTIGDFYDVIPRPNLSFLQHAKVKPRPVVFNQQRRHTRLVHADANPVAGYSRLGNFKDPIANAVSIADANLVISEPFYGEVLSELAEAEIIATEKALPVMIGVHLV